MPAITDLSQLIAAGKKDEARAAIKQALAAPLSDADRGQALVMLGMAYVQLKNRNDLDLIADLTTAMETLKSLAKTEHQLKDAQDLAAVRAKLNS